MKDFHTVVIDFFGNYCLILLISLLLIFAVYLTESHIQTRESKIVNSESRRCRCRDHLILCPSGGRELLSGLPSDALDVHVREVLAPTISADELISQQHHTAFILDSIIKELRSSEPESKLVCSEDELLFNATQCRELLQWIQRRSLLAKEMLKKPMHQMTKAFWSLVYVEAAAAQLLVVARDLNAFETHGFCLQQECRLLDGMHRTFAGDFLLQSERMQFLIGRGDITKDVNPAHINLLGENLELLTLLAKPVRGSIRMELLEERPKVIDAYDRLAGVFVKLKEEIEEKKFNDARKWRWRGQ